VLKVLPALITNQTLKEIESWNLKVANSKMVRGCNLWLVCGGKESSTVPLSQISE
jgi:hypothetical protein